MGIKGEWFYFFPPSFLHPLQLAPAQAGGRYRDRLDSCLHRDRREGKKALKCNCDPNPVVTLKLITMNEDDTTLPYHPEFDGSIEDGKTRNDIQIDSKGNI